MAKSLNVLFLSSEVDPFAKTGGLADVSGALPQVLKGLGQEVRVMMPRYGAIDKRKDRLHEMIRLKDIDTPVGTKSYPASVRSSFLVNVHDKVQVYFVDNSKFFARSGIYVHPETRKDYPDNDERFTFFSRSVFEILKKMGWSPDIIHCNDWQTALVPAYLKTVYGGDPLFKHTRTVLTVHNMAYQGVFPKDSFAMTNLPPEMLSEKGVLASGKLNFLKTGLLYADAITAVSERYAREISSSDEYGCGLQDVLRKRKHDLTGILNGVDYSLWDPSVDKLIPQRYDHRSIELKVENKQALLRHFNLPFNETTPLIGVISRLADQKGFDIIGEILDEMMKEDLQLVVLGTGEKRYHTMLERAARKYPKKVGVALTFDNSLAHLIEAGSDMFLMPSRYEPCGLNQIYSLRYGTVPIVRATGGLDDTIDDVRGTTGTGFKFSAYSGKELLNTIQRALRAFEHRTTWKKIILAGMGKDFSWESSAKKYLQVYRSLKRK
ncbi:MAG: glycogen synthase GlgA [Bacteroidota bacterium]